jgi:hypothetical protein
MRHRSAFEDAVGRLFESGNRRPQRMAAVTCGHIEFVGLLIKRTVSQYEPAFFDALPIAPLFLLNIFRASFSNDPIEKPIEKPLIAAIVAN